MSNIPDKKEFLNEWVPVLPQAQHIREEDAANWYDSAITNDPERFEWHFERLKGIGGSDIGEIVADYLGYENQFVNPLQIYRNKMMQGSVGEQNKMMRRGSYLEPVIQRIFHEDFNCKSRNDLINQINNIRSDNLYFLRANTDDVVEMNDGSVYIVDYKSSSVTPDFTTVQYGAQVHQYDLLLSEARQNESDNGAKSVDGLLVAYFDYPNGTVQPIEVPYTPEISEAISEAGRQFWEDHVLKGVPPEQKAKEKVPAEYSQDELETIKTVEEDMVKINILAKTAEEIKKEKQAELYGLTSRDSEVTLKGANLPLQTCSTKVTQKIDYEKFTNMIVGMGMSNEEFMSPGSKLDEKKVKELIKSQGHKIKDYYALEYDVGKIAEFCQNQNMEIPIKECVSFMVTPDKKEEKISKEQLQDMQKTARDFLENIDSQELFAGLSQGPSLSL